MPREVRVDTAGTDSGTPRPPPATVRPARRGTAASNLWVSRPAPPGPSRRRGCTRRRRRRAASRRSDQGVQRGETTGRAAADDAALGVDPAGSGQATGGREAVLDVGHAPLPRQQVAVAPAVPARSAVVDLDDGEAACRPELHRRRQLGPRRAGGSAVDPAPPAVVVRRAGPRNRACQGAKYRQWTSSPPTVGKARLCGTDTSAGSTAGSPAQSARTSVASPVSRSIHHTVLGRSGEPPTTTTSVPSTSICSTWVNPGPGSASACPRCGIPHPDRGQPGGGGREHHATVTGESVATAAGDPTGLPRLLRSVDEERRPIVVAGLEVPPVRGVIAPPQPAVGSELRKAARHRSVEAERRPADMTAGHPSGLPQRGPVAVDVERRQPDLGRVPRHVGLVPSQPGERGAVR